MADPLRLGPWRHLSGEMWHRRFVGLTHFDGIQTGATGWKVWPPAPKTVPLASGPETGLEGRERADEAARALGWELEGTASPLPDLLRLADLVLAFGRVERVTRHPDGVRPETDAEHTLMLAFVALTLADEHPEWGLDAGRLAVLAMVHDLPEVYAGDTNTAGGLTPSQQAAKAEREQAATERLHRELPGSVIMRALTTYERQDTPEARFLRVLDKVLPKLTHALNFGAALRELGMSVADMQAAHAAQRAKLFAEYPEWEAALGPLFDEAARVAEKAAAKQQALDLARRLWPGDWRLDADGDPTLPVEGGFIHIIVGRLTRWIVTREHAHGHTSLALGDDLALCIEHACRDAAAAVARSCNKHDDCAAAEAAAEAAGKPRPYHCTDECCEECFGS